MLKDSSNLKRGKFAGLSAFLFDESVDYDFDPEQPCGNPRRRRFRQRWKLPCSASRIAVHRGPWRYCLARGSSPDDSRADRAPPLSWAVRDDSVLGGACVAQDLPPRWETGG
jgi:hypothetical protein